MGDKLKRGWADEKAKPLQANQIRVLNWIKEEAAKYPASPILWTEEEMRRELALRRADEEDERFP